MSHDDDYYDLKIREFDIYPGKYYSDCKYYIIVFYSKKVEY